MMALLVSLPWVANMFEINLTCEFLNERHRCIDCFKYEQGD